MWIPWSCQCHQPWGQWWPQAFLCSKILCSSWTASSSSLLGFHFKPHLFRCGNDRVLLDFFFPLVMVSSRLEPAGNSSWGRILRAQDILWDVQGEAEERPCGSALGTAQCPAGTFFPLKVAGEGTMLVHHGNGSAGMLGTQLCPGRGTGELLDTSCPDPGLNSNISGSVGYLGEALLNQDAPSRV